MESVIQQIRQSRENKKTIRAEICVYETVVDGCQVKMRFSDESNNTVLESIRSMLLSARFDSMLTAKAGGESS